jgi:transcriptional regulator with XRE-family HTH domain
MAGPNRAADWPSDRELCDGLSYRLKAVREQQGLTQAELARRLGLSKSAIAKYEGGAHLPGVRVLVRLALGLGVSVDHLVGLAPAGAPVLREEPQLAEHLRELARMPAAVRAFVVETLGGILELGRATQQLRETRQA